GQLLPPLRLRRERVEGGAAVQQALEHVERLAAHLHVAPLQRLQQRRDYRRAALHQLGGRGRVVGGAQAVDEAVDLLLLDDVVDRLGRRRGGRGGRGVAGVGQRVVAEAGAEVLADGDGVVDDLLRRAVGA